MQTVLIVVHMLIVIALIAVVLLQRSEGGALGIGGGSSGGFFTGRGQANALTRATAILATLFFMTSLGLTILASYRHAHNKSIFESPAATTTAPAPASGKTKKAATGEKNQGSLLERLKKLEKDRPPAPPEAGKTSGPEQAPPRSQ